MSECVYFVALHICTGHTFSVSRKVVLLGVAKDLTDEPAWRQKSTIQNPRERGQFHIG